VISNQISISFGVKHYKCLGRINLKKKTALEFTLFYKDGFIGDDLKVKHYQFLFSQFVFKKNALIEKKIPMIMKKEQI
jgi:hypothetical protein